MSSSFRPFYPLKRLFVFNCLAFMLLVSSHGAFAQNDLAEQPGRSDVGAAVKELSRTATQSQAIPQDPGQSQQLIRILPFGRKSASITNAQAPAGAHLTYWGGPVIANIQVIAVFWGPNVSTAVTGVNAIDQFYTDITSSRYYDELSEYTTTGIVGSNGSSTSNQGIGHGTFGGKFTITPSICPEATTPTTACTVTDAQIQTELANQINAGHLPGPQNDVVGHVNTYYAIYFPPSVTITAGGASSCVNGGFCAYHSNTGSNLPYGVLPDVSTGGCALGCGSGTAFQRATNVSSHEMAEAVTDTLVGSAVIFGPPLGWYDNPPNLGEIADLCDPAQTTVSAGGNLYTVEPIFSNLQNDCVAAPPVMQMPASGAGPNVPFNLRLTMQSSNSTATLPSYRGTVHFTSADPLAVLPADYTFVSGDAGTHTFQFTLNTLGNQTISVADTHSNGFIGSTTVNVSTATDLALAVSPSQFTAAQGATGLSFATTVRNNGGTATSGTVSVVANLGSGLSATALTGTGWTCTLATLTCTRADALNSGSNYPDITLTFNVAQNAPGSAAISSTVSGGGDADVANNSDNATVNIGPVVSITSSTPSATVAAGGKAQYTIGMNLSPAAGTVTFNCSGLPAASSCSFSPTSLTASGNVIMTVVTTARAAVVTGSRPENRNPWLLLGLLSLAAMAGLSLKLRSEPRRLRRLAPVFGSCALLAMVILAGCGGGGGSPTTTNPLVGTPAGTYTITFNATSSNGTISRTMVLVVN